MAYPHGSMTRKKFITDEYKTFLDKLLFKGIIVKKNSVVSYKEHPK